MGGALVTGGAGFIGSNLVDALLERGEEVTVLDDLSTGRWENLAGALNRGARFHAAGVTDAAAVARIVAATRPDSVFHLAAQIDVRHAVADPARDATVNVIGTVTMLEAARRHGVRRFVLASTGGAIYGNATELPTPERAAPRPASPYAASKAAAESYLELYRELHGLSTMSLRLANVYGPRQAGGEAGVIAIFCAAATAGDGVTIYGDGAQTRIVELARALGLRVRFESGRAGEVLRSCLDPSAARRRLGWQATTPLEAGLERTLTSMAPAPRRARAVSASP
jgi:UDP-glucose 4-epimerase